MRAQSPEDQLFAVLFASKEAADQYAAAPRRSRGRSPAWRRSCCPAQGQPEGKAVQVPLLIHEAPAVRADLPDDMPPEGDGPVRGRAATAADRRPRRGPRPGARVPGTYELVDYKLFRFFDLNVEPGKHYQYRVRLVLANPNHLEEPTAAKPKTKPGRAGRRAAASRRRWSPAS